MNEFIKHIKESDSITDGLIYLLDKTVPQISEELKQKATSIAEN